MTMDHDAESPHIRGPGNIRISEALLTEILEEVRFYTRRNHREAMLVLHSQILSELQAIRKLLETEIEMVSVER